LTIGLHVLVWMYIGMKLTSINDIKKKKESQEANQEEVSNELAVLVFEILLVFLIFFYISWRAKRILDKKLKQAEKRMEKIKEADVVV